MYNCTDTLYMSTNILSSFVFSKIWLEGFTGPMRGTLLETEGPCTDVHKFTL